MPTYRITGPDGSAYEVDGPEGSTPEQALAMLQEQMAAQPKQEPIDYANMPAHAVAAHALSNVPKSALGVAKSVAEPVVDIVGSTLQGRMPETFKNLGHLGKGLASKGLNAAGIWSDDAETRTANESTADALGAFYKDRYGSEEGFKKALAEDPVGVVADLTTFFTGGGSAAARLPGTVGRAGAIARDAARAVDPVRRGGQAAGWALNATVPEVLGRATGQSGRVLQEGHEAGRQNNPVFARHMRGEGHQTEPLDMARQGEQHLRAQRNAQYQAARGEVFDEGGQIDFQPIDNAMAELQQGIRHPAVDGGHIVVDPAGDRVLTEIAEAIDEFRTRTAGGIEDAHHLRRRVDAIRDGTQPHTPERRAADGARAAITAQIEAQAADYAGMNQAYAMSTRDLDELNRTLSLGERNTNDTALRKLQSTMRNNAYTSWQHRVGMVDDLATRGGQPDLPAALAGQSSNAPMPRGFGQLTTMGAAGTGGNALVHGDMKTALVSALALVASSPRVMGEASHALGRARGILERAGLPQEQINRILFTAGELSQGEGEKKDADKSKRLREILMRRAAADRGQ
jgi:hypothetical protein